MQEEGENDLTLLNDLCFGSQNRRDDDKKTNHRKCCCPVRILMDESCILASFLATIYYSWKVLIQAPRVILASKSTYGALWNFCQLMMGSTNRFFNIDYAKCTCKQKPLSSSLCTYYVRIRARAKKAGLMKRHNWAFISRLFAMCTCSFDAVSDEPKKGITLENDLVNHGQPADRHFERRLALGLFVRRSWWLEKRSHGIFLLSTMMKKF